MAVNKAYCADQINVAGSRNFTHCLNDGYSNPSRCSECICPSGYGGSKCERAQKSRNAICGGDLSLELDTWEQLESPGYSKDGYEVGQQCNWVVRSPQGTRVMAEFINDFSMFCGNICLDYVELKLATDQRLTGARFCCDQRFAGQLISEHNQMAILFRAQLSQDIGFQIRVRATRLPASIQRMGGLNGPNTGNRTTEEAPTPLGLKTFLPGKDIWGEWGPWSDCSRPCGGCGIRSRTRTCLSEVCLSDKSYESSACNFLACPIRPNCHKILFLSRLCHQSDAGATSQNCSQMAQQLAQCTQPSCCPPFYALNGKCVQTQFEEGQKETEMSNRN
uniref:CUB domain-containing protein n=1 Tax=Globodera rostochiensis TaxID=31243 RepID=A0A914HYT3_GLORO